MKSIKALSLPRIASTVAAVTFVAALSGCASPAKNMKKQHQVNSDVESALTKFYGEATNARKIVRDAQGVLVCPNITKGGFVVGVEGGTCAMQIHGVTKEYYRTTSVKVGLLAGVEAHSLLLVFNDVEALKSFRDGNRSWEVGGNLSVSVAKKGISGGFDTHTMGSKVTAYVYSEAGLMGDLSIDGSTFKKLEK